MNSITLYGVCDPPATSNWGCFVKVTEISYSPQNQSSTIKIEPMISRNSGGNSYQQGAYYIIYAQFNTQTPKEWEYKNSAYVTIPVGGVLSYTPAEFVVDRSNFSTNTLNISVSWVSQNGVTPETCTDMQGTLPLTPLAQLNSMSVSSVSTKSITAQVNHSSGTSTIYYRYKPHASLTWSSISSISASGSSTSITINNLSSDVYYDIQASINNSFSTVVSTSGSTESSILICTDATTTPETWTKVRPYVYDGSVWRGFKYAPNATQDDNLESMKIYNGSSWETLYGYSGE